MIARFLPSFLRDKRTIFTILSAVWMVLWVVFIVKEDKDGEYSGIFKMYGLKGDEKARFAYGEEFYDFLIFCGQNLPAGSTFEVTGLETLSVKEVQARYFLWPLVSSNNSPDYKIIYGSPLKDIPGYTLFRDYKSRGYLLKKGT